MRICLVGTLPEADREVHRGPERTTIGLADALAERGHDVVVAADEGSPGTVDTEAHVFETVGPPGVARMAEFAVRVRASLDPDAFDVVHAWRPAFGTDVLSLHSVGMAEQLERFRPGTFSKRFLYGAKVERYCKRLTSRRAARTVVTAPKNARDAARFGIDADAIIPVGISDEFLQSDDSGGEEGADVLCVGRLSPRKQQRFVAAETPSTYSVRLAGPMSDEAYARRIPGLDALWDGPLSHEELKAAYRTAGVLALPSAFEGFGLTAVEAMAAETPVVVADTCGVAAFVSEHDLGDVYAFGDGDAYRAALERTVENRETYARNAREFVDERLRWSSIAAEYERLYETLPASEREKTAARGTSRSASDRANRVDAE